MDSRDALRVSVGAPTESTYLTDRADPRSRTNKWRYPFDGRSGDLTIHGVADLIDGQLLITELCLQVDPQSGSSDPDDDWFRAPRAGDGIDSASLRGFPVGALHARLLHEVLAQPEFDDLAQLLGLKPHAGAAHRKRAAKALEGKVLGRGRPRYPREHYRSVAETALQLQAQKQPRSLRRALADHYDVSEKTIRSWLTRARADGWLAPAEHGKRGVMPGPQLRTQRKDDSNDE